MSLILIDEKAKFVHIPKTGGKSIRILLKQSVRSVKKASVKKRHEYPVNHTPQCWETCLHDVTFTFSFIRNPLDWYESVFRQVRGRWGARRKFIYHPLKPSLSCRAATFTEHMRLVVDRFPGHCSKTYCEFIGTENDPLVDFVGLTERIDEDYATICRRIGIAYQPVPRLNASPDIECKWTPELVDAVRLHDADIFDRFYDEENDTERRVYV